MNILHHVSLGYSLHIRSFEAPIDSSARGHSRPQSEVCVSASRCSTISSNGGDISVNGAASEGAGADGNGATSEGAATDGDGAAALCGAGGADIGCGFTVGDLSAAGAGIDTGSGLAAGGMASIRDFGSMLLSALPGAGGLLVGALAFGIWFDLPPSSCKYPHAMF